MVRFVAVTSSCSRWRPAMDGAEPARFDRDIHVAKFPADVTGDPVVTWGRTRRDLHGIMDLEERFLAVHVDHVERGSAIRSNLSDSVRSSSSLSSCTKCTCANDINLSWFETYF